MTESSGIRRTPCQMTLEAFWAVKSAIWISLRALDCHGKFPLDAVRGRDLNAKL